MKKVVFRCDASESIGIGHVMRCLTLADGLKRKGAQCWFICRDKRGHLGSEIIKHGHQLALLPPKTKQDFIRETAHSAWLGCSQAEDADECIVILQKVSCDWLVVDHYAIDCIWETAVRPFCSKILVIDDLADRQHNCDVLLDQNIPLPNKTDYRLLVSPETILLIGCEYCLLREQFYRTGKKIIPEGGKPNILAYFGGTDPSGFSQSFLTYFHEQQLSKKYTLHFVTTSHNPRLDEIIRLCREVNCYLFVDTDDMAELMRYQQAAVVACGFVCYELAAMAIPTVYVAASDIQQHVAQTLEQTGIGIYAGRNFDQINLNKLLLRAINLPIDKFLSFNTGGTEKIVNLILER